MAGGKGDDLYVVDSTTDKLTELAGQGTDVVISGAASLPSVSISNIWCCPAPV